MRAGHARQRMRAATPPDEEAILRLELDDLRTEIQGLHIQLARSNSETIEGLTQLHFRVDRVYTILHQVLDRLASLSFQVQSILRRSEDTDSAAGISLDSLD